MPENVLTELLFEEPGVGRCLVGPDGTVVRANEQLRRLITASGDELTGADISRFIPDARGLTVAAGRLRAHPRVRVEIRNGVVRTPGGERAWSGTIAPVPMDGGIGLLIAMTVVSSAELHVKRGVLRSFT